LWGTKAGEGTGTQGRDILRANPDARVRIWEVDLTGTRGRGPLNAQEQHALEAARRRVGENNVDNAIDARSREPGTAYEDSSKARYSEARQRAIQQEIQELLRQGRQLPRDTPRNTPLDQYSKYDLDTLRYGDRRGNPVARGPQETVQERMRPPCLR